MRFQVLGPLSARQGTAEVGLGPFKQRCVLAALLLRPGNPVTHSEIAEFVWGEESPASAVNIVQTYMRRLRDLLEPGRAPRGRKGLLTTVGPGCYSAQVEEYELDLTRFRSLVERAKDGVAGKEALGLLIEALDLWRGPCVADLGEERRAHPWVRAVNQERVSALLSAVEMARPLGRVAETLPHLRAVAADEPLDEPLHAQLLLALAETGAESEAAARYAEISRRLADELGVDPSAQLRSAYQQVVGRIVSEREPAPAIEPVAWRGPRPVLGGLVGRDGDLARLAALVLERRVVTLVGAGGVGKTSLALALADMLADRHSGGVVVAELGPLAAEREDQDGREAKENVEAVADTLCALLGVPVDAASGALDALTHAVKDQDALLILDNAEHVTHAVTLLVDHLSRTARPIRVVITSRHPVGAAGETIWEVDPLAVPPRDDDADPRSYPAVELYLRRAEQHCPALDLSDSMPVVVELCRRVDGLPLGIELAVGRLRSISPAVLLSRINGWLGVLSRSGEYGLPHQRTLAATVEWSVNLLEPGERLLLTRLAVFAGDFDLGAAERVAGFAPLRPEQTVEMLSSLIDHSLVQVIRGDEYRYRLLAPIREASLLIAEEGDLAQARDRHLGFYRELGDALAGASPDRDGAVLARMRAESADVCAAVEWGLRPGAEPSAVADGVSLLSAGRPLWDQMAGQMETLRRWTALALAQEDRLLPEPRLKLLQWMGRLEYISSRLEESRGHLIRALVMLDPARPEDRVLRADILLGLAAISEALLDVDCVARARLAVAAAEESGDLLHIVAANAGAAAVYAWRDHDEDARERMRRAFGAAGSNRRLLGFCYWYQALVDLRAGRLQDADQMAALVLTLPAETTHDAVGSALVCLAWCRLLVGAPEDADELLDKAREICEKGQRGLLLPEITEAAAHVARRRGRVGEARKMIAENIRVARERGNRAVVFRILHLAAALAVEADDPGAPELVIAVGRIRKATGYGSWPFTAAECASWETRLGVELGPAPDGEEIRGLVARAADVALRSLDVDI